MAQAAVKIFEREGEALESEVLVPRPSGPNDV
jgi:hypothetical protein